MSKSTARPTHHAFVIDGEGDEATWTEVGAVWQHKDGLGFNIQITPGIAVTGRLVLRPVKARAASQGGQS